MDVRTTSPEQVPEIFPHPPAPRKPSRWRQRLRDDREQLPRFWPVIQNLVSQELKVRYQRSVLGFFWTLVNPLLMMMTLSSVFSFLDADLENYTVYLFAGMVPWGLLNGSIGECATCIIANEGLIRKIYVPKLVFPLSRVLINLVTTGLSMISLFVLLGPLGARPSAAMLLLPVALLLFSMFAMGLGLMVATANTFYRDCGHLVGVFLQAWYFATPIIYRVQRFPESALWRFRLNPAYYFIELFHDIIYAGRWPAPGLWLGATTIAAVSLGAGYAIFKSHEDKMVFRL